MSEGHVYLCRWRKAGATFEVWLEKRPSLRAKGESVEEALRSLGRAVCRELGDGEPYFELNPPLDPRQKDSYVALSCNSGFRVPETFTRKEYASLYEGGFCDTCCSGIGCRTDKPMPVSILGSGDILGSGLRLPKALLASNAFRMLLSEHEQSCIDWRPVDMLGKAKRTYFEIIPKRPVASVGVRRQGAAGWRCPDCRKRMFSVLGDYENVYVAASDIPGAPPPVLMIDDPHQVKPAVPWSRWQQLRGESGASGVVTRSVIFLAPSSICRRPRVRTLSKANSVAINRELDFSIDPSTWRPRLRKKRTPTISR